MHVLVLGGNGFIGGHVVSALLRHGHRVRLALRRTRPGPALDGRIEIIAADLNRDVTPEAWRPRLAGIDAVINCAGILQGRPGQDIDAVHRRGPAALFAACEAAGVHRVIHVSAISARPDAGTAYARSKCAGDRALTATALDWVILKPSLVHGAGAYGGTALMRALAMLPGVMPVVGDGRAAFNPIHAEDLAEDITRLLDRRDITRVTLEPMGRERRELRAILTDLRSWLGLAPAPVLPLPLPLVRLACLVGDLFGGPLSTTALTQLLAGNDGDPEAYARVIGRMPRGFRASLAETPVPPEARWQARSYFLRPLLRVALALVWLGSGVVGLMQPAETVFVFGSSLGLGEAASLLAGYGFSVIDLAIGAAVLARWRPGLLALVQIGVVAGYTAVLGIGLPQLWLDPFGPLLKNVAVLAAPLTLARLEPTR